MAVSPGRKRITVDIPTAVHDTLAKAGIEDGAGASTRARLLLELWVDDPELREQVTRRLRIERAARPPRD